MKLNSLVVFVLCVFSFMPLFAQEGFYNSHEGSTRNWIIYDGSGKVFGYCDETLTKMKGDSQNADISYSYRFYDAAKKSLTGGKSMDFNVAIKNGEASVFINDISKAKVSGDYMPAGDISSIPAGIRVGDIIPDSRIKVKVLSVFSITNSYLKRQVTSKDSVKVPAGTFECYLVEDDETFSRGGPFHVKTWVARGVGIVRQIIYDKDGSVLQTYELI